MLTTLLALALLAAVGVALYLERLGRGLRAEVGRLEAHLAYAEAVQRDACDQFNALDAKWTAHLAICARVGIPLPDTRPPRTDAP